jgi:hypothetical protein
MDKVTALFDSVTDSKKVRTNLICEMVRNDPKTGEEVTTIAHFQSGTRTLHPLDDTEETYNVMKENTRISSRVSKTWKWVESLES